ncbi:MAG TPA: hypothetical protein PK743_00500 [Luteimonas sp.]|nr:hypothetical protein [Luteimonas sp.]HRP71104.1 hypothetical protein [Luteimonas sp.]
MFQYPQPPSPVVARPVIPAKAGIQFAVGAEAKIKMDPGFRRDDDVGVDAAPGVFPNPESPIPNPLA